MQMATIEEAMKVIPPLHRLYVRRSAKIKRRLFITLHRMRMLKPYSFVQWLVTYRCPFRCGFCEASAGPAHEDELTTSEALELIADLARMRVRRLIFSGGEPLSRSDIFELMSAANAANIKIGLASNSYLVPENWDRLKKFDYFLFFTSLDGPAESHDRSRGAPQSHARVLEALALYRQSRTPMRMVNTVVDKTNWGDLEPLAKEIRASGATHWRLTPLSRVGRAVDQPGRFLDRQDLIRLMEFIRRQPRSPRVDLGESHTYLGCFTGGFVGHPFFCGAGLTRCSVMPNGEVLGCQQVYDLRYSEGNIRQVPFSRIWKEGFRRFRQTGLPRDCTTCAHVAACQGGCWAEMQLQGSCLRDLWREHQL